MQRIAILASGAGSNAAKIIDHFAGSEAARVALVSTNNPAAGVLEIAARRGVETWVFGRADLAEGRVERRLREAGIDLIVLAGFLWKIPEPLIAAFPRRIVNIHPALLPKFGGQGMYGMHVHRAVVAAGEQYTGITVHWVDEHYDHGDVIFQARCTVADDDDADSVARKVQALEHRHYPEIIERIVSAGVADRAEV